MEKFMLIFQGGMPAEQSPEQVKESMDKWMAWINKLAQEGKYVSGEPLHPDGGKLIKGNAKNITDGPFAEGKEIIGGYFIINAKDYDEAAALCEGYPDFEKGGSITVRQIMKMEVPEMA